MRLWADITSKIDIDNVIIQADKLEPHFSNNNYHPKSLPIENNVFAPMGRGNWIASAEGVLESLEWAKNPWEIVSVAALILLN